MKKIHKLLKKIFKGDGIRFICVQINNNNTYIITNDSKDTSIDIKS